MRYVCRENAGMFVLADGKDVRVCACIRRCVHASICAYVCVCLCACFRARIWWYVRQAILSMS